MLVTDKIKDFTFALITLYSLNISDSDKIQENLFKNLYSAHISGFYTKTIQLQNIIHLSWILLLLVY